MALLRNAAGVFTALALLSAGGIVWMLRYRYRRGSFHRGLSIDAPNLSEQPCTAAVLVPIVWRASLECGHPLIDAQRRHLFGLGNDLIQAVLNNKPLAEVEWLVDELIENVIDHFSTEESVLAGNKHAGFKQHQEIHRALLARATSMRDHFLGGQVASTDLAAFIAYDLISRHAACENLEPAVEARLSTEGWLDLSVAVAPQVTAVALGWRGRSVNIEGHGDCCTVSLVGFS